MARARSFGNIRKLPSGRYQARYWRLGKQVAADTTFASKTDARRWLATVEADMIRGVWVDPDAGRIPFSKYATRWVAERPVRPRTREIYEGQLRHIVPVFANVHLCDMHPVDVRTWHGQLAASGLHHNTVAKIYRLFRSIMTTTVDDGMIARNPVRIKGASAERMVERPLLTWDDVRALAGAIHPKSECLVWTAAASGLRFGELAGLTLEHVDLERRELRVTQALHDIKGQGPTLGPPKTESAVRTVPLAEVIANRLAAHVEHAKFQVKSSFRVSSAGVAPVRTDPFEARIVARMAQLDGRRIVVTGSTRGLGRAFAEALAADGAHVVVNGTNGDLVDEVVSTITRAGGTAVGCPGSVADDALAEQLVRTAIDEFGGIDAVVNNAGIVRDRTLVNMAPDEFDNVIAVNLRGTWSVSRHAARAMRDQGQGMLLQVISGSAFVGSVGQTNYAASKAGVMGMLYAWDLELRRFGIRTNALWPVAETDMTQVVFEGVRERAEAKGTDAPSPRDMGFGDPNEIARIVTYLCSERADHLRSQLVTFNGSKLALWQHPRETWVRRQASWTDDELAAALESADEAVYRPEM